MRRILLLMTTRSYRAGAFMEAARRLGLDVVVGSERRQALADANPGGHLELDPTRPRAAARRIADFSRRRPLSAVLAADDDGAPAAAFAAAALGLSGHPPPAVAAALDKHRTRRRLAAAGLPGPRFFLLPANADPAAAAGRAPYPCVLKPLGLSGSRGVIRADDPAGFAAAFGRVGALLRSLGGPERRVASILVEEFLPGREVALEGLLDRGELRVLALFDKPDPLDGPFFEETIYVTPSRLPDRRQRQIIDGARDAAAALGLAHGPVHAELRLHRRGVWLVEMAPRSIGGLCSRALRFTGGRSLEELILLHALGDPTAEIRREERASGVMMIPIPGRGVLAAVEGREEAAAVPGIEDLRITIPIGHPVVPLPEGDRYLGFLFARGPGPGRVETALRDAHRKLRIRLEA